MARRHYQPEWLHNNGMHRNAAATRFHIDTRPPHPVMLVVSWQSVVMNWKEVIDEHYAVAYDPAEFALSVNPPASASQIEAIQETLGFTFPSEWRALYEVTDGFGVVPKDDPDFGSDLFPPIEDLPTFVATARETIAQSHPQDAEQYIPVLDFINGDTIGYRADDSQCRLHMFNHEAMANESNQDVEDFLYPIASESLQALLLP